MTEPQTCYFCGEVKPIAVYLRDAAGDHPVCEDCHNEWADSDQEWPPRKNRKKDKEKGISP